MIISVENWDFDVDMAQNMEISSMQAAEHCDCGYCENFYQTIDAAYPSLRPFLAKFGIDIMGPDELSPFEPTICEVSYIVQGHITHRSNTQLYIDGVPLRIFSSQDADMDTVRPEPYFVLNVGLLELPWVQPEDPSSVISPANDPAYLERMEKKLLSRMLSDSAVGN